MRLRATQLLAAQLAKQKQLLSLWRVAGGKKPGQTAPLFSVPRQPSLFSRRQRSFFPTSGCVSLHFRAGGLGLSLVLCLCSSEGGKRRGAPPNRGCQISCMLALCGGYLSTC